MTKIGTKLFIVILVLAVGGLTAAGLLINFQVGSYFREHVFREQQQELYGIKELIEQNIYRDQSWASVVEILENYIHGRRVLLELVDFDSGELIFSNLERRGQSHRQHNFRLQQPEKIVIEDGSGEPAAHLHWELQGQNRFENTDSSYFMANVNSTIIKVAFFVIILTIIVSFFLSRYFTEPLVKMNNLAAGVAEGQYDQKINLNRNDELGELAEVLNKMSSRLDYLEKTREESTSDLAHELRTPLTIISNYLCAMEDGVLPLEKETLIEMKEEINRLLKLVDRLEELAETEEKILNLNKQSVDLQKITQNIISFYKQEAKQKNIELKFLCIGDLFTIKGDQNGLKTIIVNLLSNAVKYTPSEGHITLQLQEKKEKIILEVINSGPGIDKQDLPFIFSRFYRTDKSRSQKSGGAGLGLTITRKLVQAHGGEISAESKPGLTKFSIHFPLN